MQVFAIPTQDILIPELPLSLRRKVKASRSARYVRNGALITGGIATIAGAVLQGIAYQSVSDAEDFRPAEKTRADYVKINDRYEQSRVGSMAAYGLALTSGVVAGISWWYETTSERRDRDAVYPMRRMHRMHHYCACALKQGLQITLRAAGLFEQSIKTVNT